MSITDDGQRLAVRIAPGAPRLGDALLRRLGRHGRGRAAVRARRRWCSRSRRMPQNSAPQWCGVDGCLVEWPAPEVARGGTVTVPVLPGWVDPEGDPAAAARRREPVRRSAASRRPPAATSSTSTATTASGGEQLVELTVTIADTAGAGRPEAAARAGVAAAGAGGAVVRGDRHRGCRHHGGCRAACHRDDRGDVAGVGARPRRRRGDGDDRGRNDDLRLRGERRRVRSASTSP